MSDHELPNFPTLSDVTHRSVPGSYSLENLRTFMQQNRCVEILDFLQEAEGYKESYYAVFIQLGPITRHSIQRPEVQELRILWRHLALTYLSPGSSREVIVTDGEWDQFSTMSWILPPPPYIMNSTVERSRHTLAHTIFPAFLNYRWQEIEGR